MKTCDHCGFEWTYNPTGCPKCGEPEGSKASSFLARRRAFLALTDIRQAMREFDNAREANQWPRTGQPRHKDADEFIDKVREILSQNTK